MYTYFSLLHHVFTIIKTHSNNTGGTCGSDQQYSECGYMLTCENRSPSGRCQPGCYCRQGLVVGPNSNCIPQEQCPTCKSIIVYTSRPNG